MKDNGRLAKTGPGMLTSIDANQMVFSLHTDLDQAHVVFLLEWPQGQYRAEDGCRFDTDEYRRMHTAGYRLARGGDDIQVHRVLIEPSVSRAGAGMESAKDSADSRSRGTDLAPSRIATNAGSTER